MKKLLLLVSLFVGSGAFTTTYTFHSVEQARDNSLKMKLAMSSLRKGFERDINCCKSGEIYKIVHLKNPQYLNVLNQILDSLMTSKSNLDKGLAVPHLNMQVKYMINELYELLDELINDMTLLRNTVHDAIYNKR